MMLEYSGTASSRAGHRAEANISSSGFRRESDTALRKPRDLAWLSTTDRRYVDDGRCWTASFVHAVRLLVWSSKPLDGGY